MKKQFLLLFLSTCVLQISFGQTKDTRDKINAIKKTSAGTESNAMSGPTSSTDNQDSIRKFLLFYIPSAVIEAGFEPAAISSFNLGFGDDKLKFKYGFAKKNETDKPLKNSFGLSLSAEATEGVRTLYKYDETPKDITFGLVYTYVLRHTSFTYNKIASSEEAFWLNINTDFSNSQVNVFSNDSTFDEINNQNFSFLVSINHYFNSWYKKRYQNLRNIWSIGLGAGHFSNYENLKKVTLRQGLSSNTFFSETKNVAGRSGIYNRDFGLLLRGSFFYPISNPFSGSYVLLGVNYNSFGLSSNKHTSNGNVGVYISKRKFDSDTKLLTDEFSFGIVADFDNLNKLGATDYYKDNFGVMLVAQVPLRWR